MSHIKTVKKKPEKIQTILISKKDFPSLRNAKKHLEKIGKHRVEHL